MDIYDILLTDETVVTKDNDDERMKDPVIRGNFNLVSFVCRYAAPYIAGQNFHMTICRYADIKNDS
jgi:hypothetical protein